MASTIFMTGFPGFIGKRLIDRLLGKDPEASFIFLIEQHLQKMAEDSIAALELRHPGLAQRTRLVPGDITREHLGLNQQTYDEVTAEATHVWHLAAIYNLAVHASVAYRVNVIGTAYVLDFCQDCELFQRLDYVSTCYVSGTRSGLVLENDLDQGQDFKNHYESTKCWAEMEVRRRMPGMPIAIHRPAIVVGDSRTGETDKYDGPYFVINLLAKLPAWVPMVNIGQGDALVNLVPVDFLVDAMAEIWTKEEALGQTIQLADPRPHTSREIMEGILGALGYRKPLAAVPTGLVDQALSVGLVRKMTGIPQESLIYFNHEVEFDTINQRQLLEGSGISCPDFLTYLPILTDFVRQYPDQPFIDGRSF